MGSGGKTGKYLVLGIDPGLTGALAGLDVRTNTLEFVYDLPTFTTLTKSRKSGKLRHIDADELAMFLSIIKDVTIAAVVEKVGSMPGQGLSSTFRFGEVCGLIKGVLSGVGVEYFDVRPGVWKASLGLSAAKNESFDLASSLFPKSVNKWKLKKHHDRAEAAILAHYGTIKLKEQFKNITQSA